MRNESSTTQENYDYLVGTKYYKEGLRCFVTFGENYDCPYDTGHSGRLAWWLGFIHARTRRSIGPVLDRIERKIQEVSRETGK